MIQELLSAVVEERKLSFPSAVRILSDDIISPSPFLYTATSTATTLSPSSSSSTIQASPTPSPSTNSEPPQQKLRCPRCDSSNTKFCYYNNYNLTQPRHFCKTCRRYWTKGGALRNVPIGGGCRKAKPAPINTAKCVGGPIKPTKPIPSFDAVSRAGFGFGLFEPVDLLWSGPTPTPTPTPTPPAPHTSHLLALLRASGGPAGGGLGLNGPGLDPFSNAMGSAWKNEEQLPYLQIQENGLQSAVGIQELYQKLRSQAYCNDQLCVAMSNGWPAASSMVTSGGSIGGGGSSNAAVETAMGGDYGYWNPAFSSWSDMSSTNN